MIPIVFASPLPIANHQARQAQNSSSSQPPASSSTQTSSSTTTNGQPSSVQLSYTTSIGPPLTVPVTSVTIPGPWATPTTAPMTTDNEMHRMNFVPASTTTIRSPPTAPTVSGSNAWMYTQPPSLSHSTSDPTAYTSSARSDHYHQGPQYPGRPASQPASGNPFHSEREELQFLDDKHDCDKQ